MQNEPAKESFVDVESAVSPSNTKEGTRAVDTALQNEITNSVSSVVPVAEADLAFNYTGREAIEIDDATNKRLLKMIDRHVLPWLCTLYFLQFLDKSTISYFAVMNIKEDAHLVGTNFAWIGSIYYAGYVAAALPHSQMLLRFSKTNYIAVCMVLWGAVLMCMAACSNFADLMIDRAILGTLESCVSIGFIMITAYWYREYEHAGRLGIWYSFNGWGTTIGAIIAYGCARGTRESGISFPSWKLLALITGGITVIYGASMWFFMAESPAHAKWLSDQDKRLVIERLRSNQQGIGSHKFKWYQFREAFTDVRTWLYVLFIVSSQIPNGGTTVFSSVVISSFGFDSETTLLLSIPTGCIQAFSNPFFGWVADKTKQRSLTAAGIHLIALFGLCLMVGLANVSELYDRYGQLVGFYLMMGNCAISFALMLSMISSNCLGTTKKATVSAIAYVACSTCYIIGPQIFIDGPHYTKAKAASIGLWVLAILSLGAIYALNRWENKKRDEDEAAGRVEYVPGMEFMDLTDKENRKFRYAV